MPHLPGGSSQQGSPDMRLAASNLSLGSNQGSKNHKGGIYNLPTIWHAAKKHHNDNNLVRPSLLPYLNLWLKLLYFEINAQPHGPVQWCFYSNKRKLVEIRLLVLLHNNLWVWRPDLDFVKISQKHSKSAK